MSRAGAEGQARALRGAMIKILPFVLARACERTGSACSLFIAGNICDPMVELVRFYGGGPEMSREIKVAGRRELFSQVSSTPRWNGGN